MKHHFTLSERLAILVYRILREGGLVGYDYTDIISSKVTTSAIPWNMPGWGMIKKPIQRTITFTCDNPFLEGDKQVEVRLMGCENEDGTRCWRVVSMYKAWNHVSAGLAEVAVDMPTSYDQALTEIDNAKAKLKRCEARKELFDLIMRSPFAAENKES